MSGMPAMSEMNDPREPSAFDDLVVDEPELDDDEDGNDFGEDTDEDDLDADDEEIDELSD